MSHCVNENNNQEIWFISLQENVTRNCAENNTSTFAEKILYVINCTYEHAFSWEQRSASGPGSPDKATTGTKPSLPFTEAAESCDKKTNGKLPFLAPVLRNILPPQIYLRTVYTFLLLNQ